MELYWWRKQERGGYGYVSRIPVRLLKKNKKTWRVQALLKDGKNSKEVNVQPANLIPMGEEQAMWADKFTLTKTPKPPNLHT